MLRRAMNFVTTNSLPGAGTARVPVNWVLLSRTIIGGLVDAARNTHFFPS